MLSMHLFLALGIHRGGQSSRYFTRTDNGSSKSAVCSRRTSSRRSNVDNAFIGIYTIHGFRNQLLELIILGDCFFFHCHQELQYKEIHQNILNVLKWSTQNVWKWSSQNLSHLSSWEKCCDFEKLLLFWELMRYYWEFDSFIWDIICWHFQKV